MAFFRTVEAKIKKTLKPVTKASFVCLICGAIITDKSKGCSCGSGKTDHRNCGADSEDNS